MTRHHTPSPTSRRRRVMPVFGLTAMAIAWAGLASPAFADRIIDYPDGGVTLGQGWKSNLVEASPARCILFVKAESQPGQQTRMELKSVNSTYQLQRTLDIDASGQYKSIGLDLKGKAGFASDLKLNGSYSNIAAYGTVDNGRIFVAPPEPAQAATVADLVIAGKSGDEIDAALGLDALEVGRRFEALLPDLDADDVARRQQAVDIARLNAAATAAGEGDYPGAIVLHPAYADMASTDPAGFRRTCGDSYVASISRGGEIAAVFTFATKSRDKQQTISASMEGSGWGITAEASMKHKIAEFAKTSQLTINWFQSGGSGAPLPTDLDSFNDGLKGFPAAVAAAPWNYKVALKPYEDLPNWPRGADAPTRDYADMDALAFHHGKWKTLNDDLRTILDATSDPLERSQGYLLGRGVKRSALLAMQKDVQQRLAAIEAEVRRCSRDPDAEGCTPDLLLTRIEGNAPKAVSDDYGLRTELPPPVTSDPARPSERFLPAIELRERVFGFWLARTNDARCAYSSEPLLCWPQADLETLKTDIPVTNEIVVTLVSALGSRDHCFNVNTKTARVNYSAPCSLDNSNQQFVWNPNSRTLKHVATGKCMNVRGGSKGSGAQIMVFPCQSASLLNDKWTLVAGTRGGYLLKAVHSGKCVSVPNPIKTGRGLVQHACSANAQRQNWSFIGG